MILLKVKLLEVWLRRKSRCGSMLGKESLDQSPNQGLPEVGSVAWSHCLL